MAIPLTSTDLSKVRIPAELNGKLDQFFLDMKSRALEAAVRQAASRANMDHIAVVQEAELTTGAREALTASLAALTATFPSPERDIRPATDWADALLSAIRCCHVFVTVLTPRFLNSRWLDFEGGAAIASGKRVIPVLRYVDRRGAPDPLSRFQMMVVETERQVEAFVSELQNLCRAETDSE